MLNQPKIKFAVVGVSCDCFLAPLELRPLPRK